MSILPENQQAEPKYRPRLFYYDYYSQLPHHYIFFFVLLYGLKPELLVHPDCVVRFLYGERGLPESMLFQQLELLGMPFAKQ